MDHLSVSTQCPSNLQFEFKSSSERCRVRRERNGAGDGLRTRYLNLGKVALYRLSYSRSTETG